MFLSRFPGSRAALLATIFFVATFASSPAARGEVPTGETIDGIRCDSSEGAVFHIHQHLTILDHGRPVEVAGDIGRPVLGQCFYWLHTHDTDGIIHVESPVYRSFTLGNFFDIWGQPLSQTVVGPAHIAKGQLRAYVDGSRYSGNPRAIGLTLHADIVLEAGPPYSIPKPFTNWQGN
jgi:hypothetical protein